jgi:phosphoenolpyruvate carboxykinase (ATP)
MSESVFMINRERAIDYLNTRSRLYVFDGYAGWDPKHRIKVRVVCARAYHALFMHNMLIRPTEAELEDYGHPDFTIFNAGQFPANRYTTGMTSSTSIAINFKRKEMVILGTQCTRDFHFLSRLTRILFSSPALVVNLKKELF